MAKKFYAVKKGVKPGIYESWNDCQSQIHGYSGAVYKSFPTYDEAIKYLQGDVDKKSSDTPNVILPQTIATAYVDGSYDSVTNRFSCGVVLFHNGKEEHFSEVFCDNSLAEMNNVAGEIKGSERAIQYCLDNKINSITIYHDYEGIAKWCTGEWQAKKTGTKAYKAFFDEAAKTVEIHFVKVKGHSGDKYNELADLLAKEAMVNGTIHKEVYNAKEENKVAKKKSFFINREEIRPSILKIGQEQWTTFEASELVKTGNPYRCQIVADGKKAILDFYFNTNGSTTISPTGTNTDISSTIKAILEQNCTYSNDAEGKTYSFKKLPTEWSEKLIQYLKTLVKEEPAFDKVEKQPLHEVYRFTSSIGDTLVINIYNNGTITLQGKPAYLYSEAISFLSYCESVSVDDIVDTINNLHNVDLKTEDVRSEMEVLLPRSYKNLDEMILKLLSPSISLRKIKMPLEDYSCYAFPALRALEGYIKYLFGMKSITIGHTFYKIFDNGTLTADIVAKVADVNFQHELERLYNYLINNRHVIFHTEQILIGTTILEDKQEADEIVNNVLNLIETSYISINK
ncbi:ribonuclease H1 domain-containing protein [Faecalispora anaeroviscerum]|uniref:ribonuclease H1 domain-containing protein n=1 Tax=Faecalispora anaeroviscerum TaxID=2991836 RepID=UPI002DD66357|nr:viroplasmin family protein [Faecalispora anaeroviscerum]